VGNKTLYDFRQEYFREAIGAGVGTITLDD
jgi:hypothetical protein